MSLMIASLVILIIAIFGFLLKQRVRFLRNKSVPLEVYDTLASLVQTQTQAVLQSLAEEREARRNHEERILSLLRAHLMVAPSEPQSPVRASLEDEWALATSSAERERILTERLGEIDFDRDIDDLDI